MSDGNLPSVVVVIGSNSFSGASFVRYLLSLGVRVLGVSRSPEYHPVLLPYLFDDETHGQFDFYQYDINHHLYEIETLLDAEKPRLVFNFAAQSMVAQSWDYPEHWYQTNVVATAKLHEMLRNKDYLDRYIHISTPEVYGNLSGYVSENRNYLPSTPYAISRAAGDMNLHAYFDAYGFPVLFTRAANVYGPGQQLYRIIPKTILSIRSGQKLPLHGGGYSERSFIHIDDVSRATWKIAQDGKLGEVYHIATESSITIRELVGRICQELGVEFAQVIEETGERRGKDAAYLLDSSKLRQNLQWSNEVVLQDGIRDVVQWVDKNYDVLKNMPWSYHHKP